MPVLSEKRCCPFCGSLELHIGTAHRGARSRKYYVECLKCEHMGPLADTEQKAVDKHNALQVDPLVDLLIKYKGQLPPEVADALQAAREKGAILKT